MKKVGDYTLISKLGEGQFGIVYKAVHQKTKEVYAVKTILKNSINQNPKLRSLFDTEMAVMSKIKHPNILHLYEYLETGNNYYLVLDFCNAGDLEGHVKKNQCLGEQESIYFLMQVMNGFKELHKHKIMHRDFKLANIFLNDDKIIIGDFGFAKKGHEMTTTKLGSPITMAPEILNSQNVTRYTNKIDLWSIGVCFYQMIFGKPPWNAISVEDLQQKVANYSGARLIIPNQPPTSPECKDLLKRLIEPNPNQRIEWYQFYNHPLFEKHLSGQSKTIDMRQSVMFRNNEDRVNKLFTKNRAAKDQNDVQLVDPLKIKLDENNLHSEEISQTDKNSEKVMSNIRQRYVHEKKIIVFIMHTCRKLRNLSKNVREFGKEATRAFMFGATLLLKKGILMNEIALNTLKFKRNDYKLEGFEYFVTRPNSQKILEELTKDQKIYYTLLDHIRNKFESEVGLSDMRSQRIYEIANGNNYSLEVINQELRQEYGGLVIFSKEYFGESRKDIVVGVSHLFLCAESEGEFEFINENGVPFDWREFERNLSVEYSNAVLERASKII